MRLAMQMPLNELWDDSGIVTSTKRRQLRRDEISDLLRVGKVRFVVANPGYPLEWIDPAECFEFWKLHVEHRLAEPEAFCLDDFPDGWCFVASEWSDEQQKAIVLLKKYH